MAMPDLSPSRFTHARTPLPSVHLIAQVFHSTPLGLACAPSPHPIAQVFHSHPLGLARHLRSLGIVVPGPLYRLQYILGDLRRSREGPRPLIRAMAEERGKEALSP